MPKFVNKCQHQAVSSITLKPTVLFHRYLLLHICLYYYCCRCYFRIFLTYANYLMTGRRDLYVKLSDVISAFSIVVLLAIFPARSIIHCYILIFRSIHSLSPRNLACLYLTAFKLSLRNRKTKPHLAR